MSKLLGIVGKPSSGKSTFFNAATLANVPIAEYPFTTIKPNRGVAFVRTKCVCKEFNVDCAPKNSSCVNSERFIPIELLDVAGLVPGAHEGKGLGNQFLDDLSNADALIHIVDASGSTDSEGKACTPGSHDPQNDIQFLEEEIDLWFLALLKKDWESFARKLQSDKKIIMRALIDRFSGLKIREGHIVAAIRSIGLDIENPVSWTSDDLRKFATALRESSKPVLICANKSDLESAVALDGSIPTSADSELALRRASEQKLIEYAPGASDFKESGELVEAQRAGLETIRTNVLKKYGNTGVQQTLDEAVFELLKLIIVYPVEDENKLTDKKGNILPDAHLVPEGTTAREFAYKIHTDIGENFICAVDARTKKRLGADYELKDGDVVSIQA